RESTLFPYTPLFRSIAGPEMEDRELGGGGVVAPGHMVGRQPHGPLLGILRPALGIGPGQLRDGGRSPGWWCGLRHLRRSGGSGLGRGLALTSRVQEESEAKEEAGTRHWLHGFSDGSTAIIEGSSRARRARHDLAPRTWPGRARSPRPSRGTRLGRRKPDPWRRRHRC